MSTASASVRLRVLEWNVAMTVVEVPVGVVPGRIPASSVSASACRTALGRIVATMVVVAPAAHATEAGYAIPGNA